MLNNKRNIFKSLCIWLMLFSLFSTRGMAQLSLTNIAPSANIDFSNTMPTTVGTNTSTAYTGAGFAPNPTNATPGRLNSNAWAAEGWSNGDLLYGGTQTTAATDYTRGSTALPITPGGFYAYTGAPGSVANPAFMIQPGSGDFEPGTLTLKLVNNGTTIITSIAISYNLFQRNDQSRGDSLNFSYSSDNFINSDYPVPSMDYASPQAPDALGWVQVGTSPSRSATISTGVYVAPGSVFYLRWRHAAGGGAGSRDELGLDDINITATYSSPCTPPTTQAVINSFSGVLSSQMDVNYTRGNGTGGVLIIASTSATLSSNPVSGVTYSSNSNFGNGDPVGGGFVVYTGTANGTNTAATLTVTGLNPSTLYYFYVIEYDVTVPCYNVAANTGSQTTAAGSATSPTDYFRSRISGNWNNSNNWESSPDNVTWITATLKPTFSAKGILIQSPHIITISNNETAKLLNIASGGTLTYNNTALGGWDLDIAPDATDIDFKISGTYIVFGKAATIQAGATVQVYSGGVVRADANVGGPNTSDDFARYASVFFATGSVFQWNAITSFQTSSATYFPNALATDIATFRITQNIPPVGAATTTTINGLLEVNGNVSFQNGGTKVFRNGIIGTATLTQGSTGPFVIDGATAVIGGAGVITLNAAGTLNVATGSVTTLTSNKTINTAGGIFNVDGTLLCSTFIVGGSCAFSLNAAGTLGIGSTDGITILASGAIGNIQVTNGRSYNAAANYLYNSASSNQVTGNGLPFTITTGGSLTISNTGAASNNTVTLTTNNTTTPILNLTNGLFEAGAAQSLKIAATGTVNSLAPGGNQGLSAAAGTIWFIGTGTINPGTALSLTNVYLSNGVVMGGANTTIKGTLTIGASGFVSGGTAPTYSSSPASTLLYNCGCNFGAGNEWYANTYGTSAGVPHHVTLAAGTSMNFGATAFPHEMRGDLTINNGSTFALSSNFGGDLYIKGNWTRTATGSFTSNVRAVKFNGSGGDQTVTRTGGGTEFFPYMIIDKSAGQAVVLAGAPNATNINVDGFFGGNTLQLISGDLDLNQQTLNFASFINSNQNNLGIDGTAGNLTRNVRSTGGNGTFAVFNNNAVTHNITVTRMSGNASLLVFGSTVTLTTGGVGAGGGGINFGNTLTTINGTLQINGFGFVTGFAPTYGTGSFLVYNTGSTFDRNVEWGSLSGPGYPYHVSVLTSDIRLNTPAINGDADRAMAGNLSIAAGYSLLLSTTANNTLTVGGNVQIDGTLTLPTSIGGDIYIGGNWNRSATGVFTPNDRAVFFNGSTASTITASSGQLFPYLYLTKNALGNSLTLVDDIYISKEFTITTGTFDLAGKNATLLSDASGTANFGKVGAAADVSYSGAGRFIVERYIPTGVLGGQHGKSWQFLAVPDNGGQTINAGWQEGNTLPAVGTAGLGTIISSNVAGAGFDIIGGSTPAMKTYVAASDTWAGVANTASLPLHNQKGYFLFVRGDRTVTAFNQPATTTNLRSTGKLFVPGSNPPPATTVLPGKFESIGNPYASAIDFLNITKPAAPAVDDVFYVWDPLLAGSFGFGGYQTISATNGYKPNPGGTANYSNAIAYTKIQSGQAFMVHSTGAGGTVSFTENAKISGSNLVFRPNTNAAINDRQYLRCELYTADGKIADGNVLAFDQSFINGYEANDALKILNAGENFGIKSNGKLVAIEARSPVMRTDTIHYIVSNLRQQGYQFRFAPENMGTALLNAWLIDKWLGTRTQVSLSAGSIIGFTVSSDPASSASDRFMIIFKRKPRQANNAPLLTERSNSSSIINAKIPYSTVSDISVYPNPVVNKRMQLEFQNKPAGNYELQLTNSGAQVVFECRIAVKGDRFSKAIQIAELPAGYYTLAIMAENGSKFVKGIVIE